MYTYIYIYIYTYIYIYIYIIHIYYVCMYISLSLSLSLVRSGLRLAHAPGRASRKPLFGRGDDTVGNPHRTLNYWLRCSGLSTY